MKEKHFLKHLVSIAVLLFLTVQQLTAQKSISGTVKDEQKSPVAGATVLAKGTTIGVSTDASGKFDIRVPESATRIVVSFIGYTTQEVNISGKSVIHIVLPSQASALADVVVVGYGTAKKKDLTGALSTISSKDLNPGPVTSPLQQIAGKAAGVNVVQVGSEPGIAPSVRIRGITSLTAGSDPLVVVDGVQGNMDLFRQVPPNEIESVDVLKDASATAIYGSRGAPGVIIVTTKKTRAGKTTMEFTSTASVDLIRKRLEMLDGTEWWEQAQKLSVPAAANHASNTDWFDLLTRNGVTQNHTLAFGGGTDKFNYRASLSAIQQNGIVINSSFKNYIARLQATQKALDDKLTFTFNLNSNITNSVASNTNIGRAAFTSNLISNSYVMRPTDPVFFADGSYFSDVDVFQYINPYAVALENISKGGENSLFGSLRADLEIVKGLTAGWFGSWRKKDAYWGYYLPAISTVSYAIDNKGVAHVSNNRNDERLMNISLTYKKTFDKHKLEALGLYEYQTQVYQGNFAQAKGFINDKTTFNALQNGDLSRATPGDVSSYLNDRNLVSFLTRVNYSFLDKYLLTASVRRDGSSVFGPNQKWGNFPSASVAWRVIDERFMSSQRLFNDLKLRIGYGITGNQQGLYPQQSTQLVGSAGITYFGGSQITNFAITQNANSDLRWETRKQWNIGVDFATQKGKLSGTVDVFRAVTDNLLFDYAVPQPPYPFGSIKANVGSLLNQGIELSLNYQALRKKDMSLTLSGNISYLQNKILELSGSLNGVPLNTDYVGWGWSAFLIKGRPMATFNVFKHEGIDALGKEVVVDRDKNGSIDFGSQSLDRYDAGSALPKYTFAITPTFTYKNLDVSMLWRGAGGNKVYNGLRSNLSRLENLGKSNVLKSAVPLGLFTSNYASDLFLEDGDFVRFENLTVGYRLNTQNIKYIESFRFSLTAQNIAVFTKYTGIDPELNGALGIGGENGVYPRTTNIALGVSVTLK